MSAMKEYLSAVTNRLSQNVSARNWLLQYGYAERLWTEVSTGLLAFALAWHFLWHFLPPYL